MLDKSHPAVSWGGRDNVEWCGFQGMFWTSRTHVCFSMFVQSSVALHYFLWRNFSSNLTKLAWLAKKRIQVLTLSQLWFKLSMSFWLVNFSPCLRFIYSSEDSSRETYMNKYIESAKNRAWLYKLSITVSYYHHAGDILAKNWLTSTNSKHKDKNKHSRSQCFLWPIFYIFSDIRNLFIISEFDLKQRICI